VGGRRRAERRRLPTGATNALIQAAAVMVPWNAYVETIRTHRRGRPWSLRILPTARPSRFCTA